MTAISVCMIVRNEQDHLAKCLSSVRPWVDEICIVDTGSTDGTIEIAKSFGAITGEFPWCDDFSKARNASLELATKPWILVIDADEVFSKQSGPILRDAIKNMDQRLAWLLYVNSLDGEGKSHPHSLPRLFRNRKDIRFSRPIHESIMDSLFSLGETALEQLNIHIEHHGYTPQMAEARNKHQRNIDILKRQANMDDSDLFNLYKLAQTLSRPAEAQEQLKTYRNAFDGAEKLSAEERAQYPFLPFVYAGYATSLLRDGKISDSIRVTERGLELFPDNADLVFRRGDLARRVGDRAKATQCFQKCLATPPGLPLSGADPALGTVKSALGIARILFTENQIAEARTAVERALEYDATDREVRTFEVRLCFAEENVPTAVRKLEELLDEAPLAPEVQYIGGEISWWKGDLIGAVTLWKNAMDNSDIGQTARCRVAIAEVGNGRLDAAQMQLQNIVARDLQTAACKLTLAVIANVDIAIDSAFNPNALRSHVIPWLQMLQEARGESALGAFATNSPRYEEKVPKIGTLLVAT